MVDRNALSRNRVRGQDRVYEVSGKFCSFSSWEGDFVDDEFSSTEADQHRREVRRETCRDKIRSDQTDPGVNTVFRCACAVEYGEGEVN